MNLQRLWYLQKLSSNYSFPALIIQQLALLCRMVFKGFCFFRKNLQRGSCLVVSDLTTQHMAFVEHVLVRCI